MGYDEGLDDDRVMAATVWRRFYGMSHDVKAEHIEYIVKFIRKQVSSGLLLGISHNSLGMEM